MVLKKERIIQMISLATLATVFLIGVSNNPTTEATAPIWEPIPEDTQVEIVDTLDNEEIEYLAYERCEEQYYLYINEMQSAETPEDRMLYFKAFKEFIENSEGIFDPPEMLEDVFDEATLQRLYSVIEGETKGGDFDSKVNVANVIFNRLDSENWPDSLEEVLNQKGQFYGYSASVEESTVLAAEYSWLFCEDDQAIFFQKSSSTPSYAGEYLYTDDIGHSYFSEKHD